MKNSVLKYCGISNNKAVNGPRIFSKSRLSSRKVPFSSNIIRSVISGRKEYPPHPLEKLVTYKILYLYNIFVMKINTVLK